MCKGPSSSPSKKSAPVERSAKTFLGGGPSNTGGVYGIAQPRQSLRGDLDVFDALKKKNLDKVGKLDDFIWSDMRKDPHPARRTKIMKAHPEVRKLIGPEPITKWVVLALVAAQVCSAIYIKDDLFTLKGFVFLYVVGATLQQAVFLAAHEIVHNLAFKSKMSNKVFNMSITNLPMVFPMVFTFQAYHLEHHTFQGLEGVDTDLPTAFEGWLFGSFAGKLFFLTFQILFYMFRPMAVKVHPVNVWHLLNLATCMTFNAVMVHYFGWNTILYLVLSTFMAGGLHPCAAHFLAEHYVFTGEVETYSYYGPLNWLTFNVGYHNEHHDFPNIAWTRLPELKRLAPEFYDILPYHSSWPMVIWKFLTDSQITPHNRVKRTGKEPKKLK